MSNCLECGTELTQTEGKREKKYCGNTCRVKYYLKEKNKDKPKGKRGRPAKNKETSPPKEMQSTVPLEDGVGIGITEDENGTPTDISETSKQQLKPTMPKGLSLEDRIKWMNDNYLST